MSIRLEMLQVARLAPRLLGDSAELVRNFVRRQQHADGGFKDRSEQSDLYYTVFGLDCLAALQVEADAPGVRGYLERFEGGADLDFVHLCCLARCRAALERLEGSANKHSVPPHRDDILRRIEQFRTADGGYNPAASAKPGACGTAYGCFLAFGAYQDLRAPMPESLRLSECLSQLRTPDGGWANERHIKTGATNATAASIILLRQLHQPVDRATGDWLLARFHSEGGFLAAPQAPIPDLLSTATALHALSGLERDISGIREACLDFIDTLWTNEGAFHGHWGDDMLDVEYTFYGLLALGHLSV
jgi:prenyltransferase beta subunit